MLEPFFLSYILQEFLCCKYTSWANCFTKDFTKILPSNVKLAKNVMFLNEYRNASSENSLHLQLLGKWTPKLVKISHGYFQFFSAVTTKFQIWL